MNITKDNKKEIENILKEIDGMDYIKLGNTVVNVKMTSDAINSFLKDENSKIKGD